DDLLTHDEVSSITGLANTEALNGYTLTEKLTPRQFSELINIDYEIAELIYAAYAVDDEDYAKAINGLANYRVPLIDMFMFVYQEVEEGYVTLDDELMEKLEDANRMMTFAKNQLQGENFSRILVYLTLPEESDETFAFIDELHTITEKYYDADKIYVVGESVSQYDLKKCFARDNTMTGVISILAVLVVLLFTFKSAGMPVLLIAVIQGCIWINFSFPAIEHDNLFFLGYLIVSSIQMGANIDYAIVIAGRYTELRETMGKRDAIIDTMNLSFPTIITSGTMLAVAGTLIGKMTSDCAIYGIGKCLGRGTIISIFVTMFVLPQILLVGDKVIELTAFVMNMPVRTKQKTGLMRIDGFVRGHIDGNVDGTVHAIVRGNLSAYVESGDVQMLEGNDTPAAGENILAEGEVN
ncbi:MAG: MMPL family transporter, partial [Lachnospiraceae bacterium]|nr:MMPL family transporter [Lachnospiraceae bacterium]